MFMPVFVILNLLCIILLYILLCNTAIIKTKRQDNGKYIYDKKYIIGSNSMGGASIIVTLLLIVIPITWLMCIFCAGLVVGAYLEGHVDVFGKNKLVNYDR